MEPLSFDGVKTYPLKDRKSKVSRTDFAKVVDVKASLGDFLESFPNILMTRDLRLIAASIVNAREEKRPILWAFGAHVMKVGLNPVIIDLMKNGFITGIALNGAGIIHDVELALVGQTSEDVSPSMNAGHFGMAEETGQFINEATLKAYQTQKGLGESVGQRLIERHPPYLHESILGQTTLLKIPVTVHVAIGGDIVHMHPRVSGEAIGAASFRDFQIFCAEVSKLSKDGVILNIGSAVVLPVVIEKAIAICRNLGYPVEGFVGVNFDFISHYRSGLNPVARAKDLGGKGYQVIGPHEILIPLLAAAVKVEAEKLELARAR